LVLVHRGRRQLALLLLVAGLVAGAQAGMTFRGQEAQTVAAAKALAERVGVDASKFIKLPVPGTVGLCC